MPAVLHDAAEAMPCSYSAVHSVSVHTLTQLRAACD